MDAPVRSTVLIHGVKYVLVPARTTILAVQAAHGGSSESTLRDITTTCTELHDNLMYIGPVFRIDSTFATSHRLLAPIPLALTLRNRLRRHTIVIYTDPEFSSVRRAARTERVDVR